MKKNDKAWLKIETDDGEIIYKEKVQILYKGKGPVRTRTGFKIVNTYGISSPRYELPIEVNRSKIVYLNDPKLKKSIHTIELSNENP